MKSILPLLTIGISILHLLMCCLLRFITIRLKISVSSPFKLKKKWACDSCLPLFEFLSISMWLTPASFNYHQCSGQNKNHIRNLLDMLRKAFSDLKNIFCLLNEFSTYLMKNLSLNKPGSLIVLFLNENHEIFQLRLGTGPPFSGSL